MRRRRLTRLLAGLPMLTAASAAAQVSGRVYRLGILRPTSPPSTTIQQMMGELGYREGHNLVVEQRFAEGRTERLPGLARELVAWRPDVIVAVSVGAARAALAATSTIPIVVWGNFDPVAAGLARSLARPGGNVTGVLIAPEDTLAGKKIELLREAVPSGRMAFLAPDPDDVSVSRTQSGEVGRAAAAQGIDLYEVAVRDGNYERALTTIAAGGARAVIVAATTYFMSDRARIIPLTIHHRLASMWEWPDQVVDGGLMSYGSRQSTLLRRVATYVERLFRGANPAELPFEQPTRLELVINLRTAKAIGLTLPQSIVARADELIE